MFLIKTPLKIKQFLECRQEQAAQAVALFRTVKFSLSKYMIHWDNAAAQVGVETAEQEQLTTVCVGTWQRTVPKLPHHQTKNVFIRYGAATKGVKSFLSRCLSTFYGKSFSVGCEGWKIGYFWCRKLQLLLMFVPSVPLITGEDTTMNCQHRGGSGAESQAINKYSLSRWLAEKAARRRKRRRRRWSKAGMVVKCYSSEWSLSSGSLRL